MNDVEQLRRIGEWLGTPWTPEQERLLIRFTEYLSDDGVVGGALGPHEGPRMIDRHVGDSLVYLSAIDIASGTIVDVGSGAGLPGIPLAIARPDLQVTLLDRSRRRTDLASRAIRILGIDNVDIGTGEVSDFKGLWDVVVFRASLGLGDAVESFERLTPSNGQAVFGVSRLPERPDIPEPPAGVSFELTEDGGEVLDSPSWLLRMKHL
jgi:16S rRNA (guanine527-N7)-methyltransferase